MTQLPSTKVVEPFGEVNFFHEPDGSLRIKASILMKPIVENAKTGLAIDGSNSMKPYFGNSPVVSSLFASSASNIIEPVARTLTAYLAAFDSHLETTVIYWACGEDGYQIEEIGVIKEEKAEQTHFRAPKRFGTGTKLLPAVKYFVDQKYPTASWAIFVFITDGILEDLEEVKRYSLNLAKLMAQGTRGFIKLVLIGLGTEIDEKQMEELDDLDYGGLTFPNGDEIDIWDHKLAAEMQRLEEIFAEVVSQNTILAPSAEILDNRGCPVKSLNRSSYRDGLPALLHFIMPRGSTAFQLVLPNNVRVTQPVI